MGDDLYVELDEYRQRMLQEYLAAAASAQQWADRRDELSAELIGWMGVASKATVNGRHVLTRVGSGMANQFSQSRFKEAYPDLYNDFVVPVHRRPHLRLPK